MLNYAVIIKCRSPTAAKLMQKDYERRKTKCHVEDNNVVIIVQDKDFAEFLVAIIPKQYTAKMEERP